MKHSPVLAYELPNQNENNSYCKEEFYEVFYESFSNTGFLYKI